MTSNQKTNIENLLNEYQNQYDYEYNLIIKYDNEGNKKVASKAYAREESINSFIEGITKTLYLLGYSVKYEYINDKFYAHILDI